MKNTRIDSLIDPQEEVEIRTWSAFIANLLNMLTVAKDKKNRNPAEQREFEKNNPQEVTPGQSMPEQKK